MASSTVFLAQPILHVSAITHAVTDQDIISALHECLRARLRIDRSDPTAPPRGTVEFEKLENAEKAYATLHGFYFPHYNCSLQLSHSPDPDADPKPSARIRLIKFLPPDITPGRLFNTFRPFGPIYRISLNYHHTPDGLPFFSGTAVIEFYSEPQASLAQTEMHCYEIDHHTIAVEEYDDRRDKSGRGIAIINSSPQSKWAQAAPFVPFSSSNPSAINSRRSSHQSPDTALNVSKWASTQAPQQQQSYPLNSIPPPTSPTPSRWASPHSPQPSGPISPDLSAQPTQKQVDPCNLFIKGLCVDVESGDLFHAFKQFGTIVSARVMKNEATGISRQFGFVSFTTEEAASNALQAMDGATIGQSSNKIVVRLHELKKFKEGRTKVITVSPTQTAHFDQTPEQNSLMAKLEEAQTPVPDASTSLDGSQVPQQSKTLPSGTASINLRQSTDEPTGAVETSRQQLPTLEIENSSNVLSPPVAPEAQPIHPTATSRLSSSFASPSNISTCGSPTTSTTSSTLLSEREKMLRAVSKLNDQTIGDQMEELIELLMALPIKERKLCLFNPQVLVTKVSEAKEIIETPDDVTPVVTNGNAKPSPSVNPSNLVTASNLALVNDSQPLSTPAPAASRSDCVSVDISSTNGAVGSTTEKSSTAPSKVQPSSIPSQPENHTEETKYATLKELGKLSSKEIIEIVLKKPELVQDGLIKSIKKNDEEKIINETQVWLNDKIFKLPSIHQQKQKIGEKLFKILKSFGFKGCPKLTVDLLDSEDLRSLSLLMNLFPEILKEKVILIQSKS